MPPVNHSLAYLTREIEQKERTQPPSYTSGRLLVFILLLSVLFGAGTAIQTVYIMPGTYSALRELKDIRKDQSDRENKALRTSSQLEESRATAIKQQAEIVRLQLEIQRITEQNLKLASDLNRVLTQRE